MPTELKEQVVEKAKERYSRALGVVFTEYRGLKVKDIQGLRQNLKSKGGDLQVLKNTLFRLAAGSDVEQLPTEFHAGPTAVAFVYENEPDCAKALFDFAKTNKNLKVKGAYIGGKVFSADQVKSLSELPPREVLIAQVIGAVAAPLSNLVGVIEALYADPIRVIGAVADKVAEGSPLPEPKAEAAAEEPAPAEESAPSAEEAPTQEENAGEAEAAPAEETQE